MQKATMLTKYEKARLIGVRAEQLARGSPPKIPINNMRSPVEIATKEYEQGAIPICVIRKLPNGQKIKVKFN
jgi:DNA-directed RNA polymerase I, II, and III subunit RPABC2